MRFHWWEMHPRIHAARPEDARFMAALHRTAFPRGWSAEEIARLLDEAGAVSICAWRADELLGFGLARAAGGEAEVLSIAVAERARGRGLGGAILDALEHGVRSLQARAMFLEVSEANTAALSLYYRADYHRVGRRPRYYEDGAAALTMRKYL